MPQIMYHVFYDLETRFRDLQEAESWLSGLSSLVPEVPHTGTPGEDKSTARVCVAPTVADCINGIKLYGVFRRCLYASKDDPFKSYENDDEVYPIIVVKVEGNFIKPAQEQVEDVAWTNEFWSLHPVKIVDKHLYWLGSKSIEAAEVADTGDYKCIAVRAVKCLEGMNHPWLNGRGHPLICSYMGSESWASVCGALAVKSLYYDSNYGRGGLVFVQPESLITGYGTCTPVSGEAPYRGRLDLCHRFIGFFDQEGEPIFEDDWVSYTKDSNGHRGFTVSSDNFGGLSLCSGTDKLIPFYHLERTGFVLSEVKDLERRDFASKYASLWRKLFPVNCTELHRMQL